jgi:hypothetical protein
VTAGGGGNKFSGGNDKFGIIVGSSYAATAWVYSAAAVSVQFGFEFRDSTSTIVATLGPTIALAANTWTLVNTVQIAPATAATGNLVFIPQAAATVYVQAAQAFPQVQGIVDATTIEGATLIIQSTAAAVLIYNGAAGAGTLIGSWASTAGTDSFGNAYPAGINANQGTLTGTTLSTGTVVNSILNNPTITGGTIGNSAMTGGTIVESTITFDTGGGQLLGYASTTTTITQTANGTYTWTPPAGVTSANIQCWGAGGGGGGSAGSGGGGGEYAQEANYAVTPGTAYTYVVGNGGAGAVGNADGSSGTDTYFNFGANPVYANGGNNGLASGATGGAGGTGSTNSVHHNGGTGGTSPGSNTGGGGGGSSAGTGAAGHNGSSSSGTSGGAGGTAVTGGGAGGAGGNSGVNGTNGGTPGGGGGAGGFSSTTTTTKTYNATGSASYYGTGTGGSQRNSNGSVYHGDPSGSPGSFPGNQFGFWSFPSTMQSDLAGVTINSVNLTVTNQHSYNSTGMTFVVGWSNRTSFPGSINPLGAGDLTNKGQTTIAEGSTHTYNINTYGAGAAIQSGAFKSLLFGPSTNDGSVTYYGYFAGGANSATLAVNYTTAGSPTTAGSGSDGKVVITYASTQTLVLAVSPQAGTDANGNAYGAGFTGTINAFQPGASPAVVETWHPMTLLNGWAAGPNGTPSYKMCAQGKQLWISGELRQSSAPTAVTIAVLPSAYWPAHIGAAAVGATSNVTSGATAFVQVDTTGNVTIGGITASTNPIILMNAIIPLDL